MRTRPRPPATLRTKTGAMFVCIGFPACSANLECALFAPRGTRANGARASTSAARADQPPRGRRDTYAHLAACRRRHASQRRQHPFASCRDHENAHRTRRSPPPPLCENFCFRRGSYSVPFVVSVRERGQHSTRGPSARDRPEASGTMSSSSPGHQPTRLSEQDPPDSRQCRRQRRCRAAGAVPAPTGTRWFEMS